MIFRTVCVCVTIMIQVGSGLPVVLNYILVTVVKTTENKSISLLFGFDFLKSDKPLECLSPYPEPPSTHIRTRETKCFWFRT